MGTRLGEDQDGSCLGTCEKTKSSARGITLTGCWEKRGHQIKGGGKKGGLFGGSMGPPRVQKVGASLCILVPRTQYNPAS